ncbi:hypothetical protein Tco_1046617 [Tanacetum coccineum]
MIWRNKTDLEELSLGDLFNNLKIYEAEVKGSSSSSQNIKNVAFVSSNNSGSTNQVVKTAHGVSTANSKDNASTLPNVNSLSDAVIYSLFARDGLEVADGNAHNESKKIYPEDRKESRECRAPKIQDNNNRETPRRTAEDGPTNFALMALTSSGSSSSSGSDNESQLNVAAYKAGLESVEDRLVVYQKNKTVYEEEIKILKINVMLRDKALAEHRKRFEKAENERDELKLRLEKFENSSKNLSKLLDSQVSDYHKSGLGYDSQVGDEDKSDEQNISQLDKNKTSEGYHAVPPPYIGNYMPSIPDLVLADTNESVFIKSARKDSGAPIIED